MSQRLPKSFYFALAAATAVGLYARLAEIGLRPLAVDEYYFIKSVGFILDSGLPEFPSGGYYMRGVVPQYLTAAFVLVFGADGFAWRLQAVIFSLASVALSFIYSRRFVGPVLAASVAIALLISSWHIEFGRFARMYGAFQFTTLLFLIAADRAFFRQQWRLRYLPHALVIVAVLTHRLGVLFLPFLFIPFLKLGSRKCLTNVAERVRFASTSLATSFLCLAYYRYDFRGVGVDNALPELFAQSANDARSLITVFPHWSIAGHPLFLVVFWAGLLAAVAVLMNVLKKRTPRVREADIFLALLLTTTAGHLFVLSALLVLVLIFRYEIHRTSQHPPHAYAMLGVTVAIGAAWIAYAVLAPGWVDVLGGESGVARAAWHAFFRWPNLYSPVLRRGLIELPMITAMVIAAVVYLGIRGCRRSARDFIRHPAFVVLYVVFCLGLIPHGHASRYVFFIYPVALCTIVMGLNSVTQQLRTRLNSDAGTRRVELATAALFLGLFALTRDFNPTHIAQITSPQVAYRVGEFARFARTWYPNQDSRSPSQFVNMLALDRDKSRIVIDDLPPPSFYLHRDHAVYHDFERSRFSRVSRERGTLDLWSNQRLLASPKDLRDYTARANEVWIIRETDPDNQTVQLDDTWGDRLWSYRRVFLSIDEKMEVVRVKLAEATMAAD